MKRKGGEAVKWYTDKLKELEKTEPVYSVCGDDCAVCPRYVAETEEELRETAEFWYKVGWRDRIVSTEEISCSGCGSNASCAFGLLPCTREHGVAACAECDSFKCGRIHEMLENSAKSQEACRAACDSEEEFMMIYRSFWEKEKNLEKMLLE